MERRELIALLGGGAPARPLSPRAQQHIGASTCRHDCARADKLIA